MGLVWNLSRMGISMLLNRSASVGHIFPVTIVNADESYKLAVCVRVAHVARLGTGDYVIGAQFDSPIQDEEILPFLS